MCVPFLLMPTLQLSALNLSLSLQQDGSEYKLRQSKKLHFTVFN